MTLRPVAPGHVAVRPRPTPQRPGAWCIVTVGPVKHFVNVLEQDSNPSDPRVFLHCYGFVSRDIALYAARQIIRNGWLHTCDEPYPDDHTASQKNRCVQPLGHEGMHGNGYYRWTPENWVPASYGTPQHIEFDRGELKMWSGSIWSADSVQQDEEGRCTATDEPFGPGVRCQLPLGHPDPHRHEDRHARTSWLDKWRNQ